MSVPTLQTTAPNFEGTAVVDGQFKDIRLRDYKGQYLVLFFYSMDFAYVCPTEIIAFSDRYAEFAKIKCAVVAVSAESKFNHLAWISKPRVEGGLGKINITLLSDKSMKIAKDYGMVDADSGTGVPWRGLFIIDGKQKVRQVIINDISVGRSVDEVLRSVKALQYWDKNSCVCSGGSVKERKQSQSH